MFVRLRYLIPFLLSCAPAFAVQNSSESVKPQHRGVPIAAPTNAKPPVDGAPSATVVAPTPAALGVTITAEQWARPRSGSSIVQLPGLGALVEAVERDAASRLVIRFAGGDEGSLWAEELRSWLVALGLPSARIVLEPGLPQADKLQIELRPPR